MVPGLRLSSTPCYSFSHRSPSLLSLRSAPLQVAATLGDQTHKLNKIVDDLNEIEFTMKTASKVIRDITRGLLTDK